MHDQGKNNKLNFCIFTYDKQTILKKKYHKISFIIKLAQNILYMFSYLKKSV